MSRTPRRYDVPLADLDQVRVRVEDTVESVPEPAPDERRPFDEQVRTIKQLGY